MDTDLDTTSRIDPGWDDAGFEDLEIGIAAGQLDRAFPFHFAVNFELEIVQIGRTIARLLPELNMGSQFADWFRLSSPKIGLSFSAMAEQRETVFFIESLQNSNLTMRGQFLLQSSLSKGHVLLFIGSPVVRDMEAILSLGLGLNDFATHDAVLDLLLLLQSKTNTIVDTQRMAEQLKNEVLVRRQAEDELRHTNESLEEMIAEATEELANTNRELKSSVETLQVQNEFMTGLNRMSDQLQACRSMEESSIIIASAMQNLYPGSHGMVSFNREGGEDFVYHTSWGKESSCKKSFKTSQCPAIAPLGKTFIGNPPIMTHCENLSCPHLCLPLVAQQQVLGVLHIGWDYEVDPFLLSEDGQAYLRSAGEHIMLALINIRLQESLQQLSTRDPLTGLYNRRFMEDTFYRELKRAQRSHNPISVIMADVDHFKSFNDTHGHEIGDQVLCAMARFFEEQVRGEDVPCRYGGEEFILILPGASLEDAAHRAEQICNSVSAYIAAHQAEVSAEQVTLSLGVSSYPDVASNLSGLLRAADDALYAAKRNGRNRVEIAPKGNPSN